MFNIYIVKDRDIGLEYECVKLDSDIVPEDIETFFPRDWFSHWSGGYIWDYIIWDFIKVEEWDIIIKCVIPTYEQIDKSALLSYKSDMFSRKELRNRQPSKKKIWLGHWAASLTGKMIFVLHSEDTAFLYGKNCYNNFSYLDI